MIELPERTGTILKIIVGEYISSGVAVSSDAIYRRYALNASPATIRHEMAYLAQQGFITRPHTSAGGIPSDKGYRYYVEGLMDEAQISTEERTAIRRRFKQARHDPDEWARLAVSILTQKLQNIALATPLRAPVCHLRHLDIISLDSPTILVVLVLREGKTKQRFLTLDRKVPQDALSAAAARLSEAYRDRTVSEIRSLSIPLSPIEDIVTQTVLRMMQVEDAHQHDQFYVDGWRYLVAQANMIRANHMLSLVEALEKKSMLSALLANLRSERGISVTIGSENEEEALRECTVVLSHYGVGERRGAIGVIGPTRMPYGRVIPIVDYVSSLMSELASETYS
ncbi:MAG: heat-inducible transcriptional repressor HrcA [Dehalococcoidia bacterium]|nr:heat-inducible transcriptional repressor HrcA [Dehalococcoidia bacterium]